MSNVAENRFPSEAPTVPKEYVSTKFVAFAARVEKLTELALARLRSGDDRDAVAAPLVQLHALLVGVLR
jgi:hypothetical protein